MWWKKTKPLAYSYRIKLVPQPTITHGELVKVLADYWKYTSISREGWEKMPPEVKKHFERC